MTPKIADQSVRKIFPFKWFLPVMSGLLIGTSYIPFPPWASIFCFVPLWLFWLRQTRARRVFLGGWVTSFILTLVGFNWVAYTLHEFAHLPWPLAIIGLLLYAALAQLYIPVVGLLWWWLRPRLKCPESASIVLLGLLTALGERYSPTLFDWNFGYTWYAWELPIYQWAEWIGFSGISTFTVLMNILCCFFWNLRRYRKGWLILGAIGVLLLSLNGAGTWFKERLAEPDRRLTALVVQGNIGNEEKSAAELGSGFRDAIIQKYFDLTDQALAMSTEGSPDIVIWPEAAFPSFIDPKFAVAHQYGALRDFVRLREMNLITGAYGVDASGTRITNSLFAFDKRGEVLFPHYSKTILLAFGEYIPGIDLFPFLGEWLPPIGQYARGPGPSVLLQPEKYRIGPQICYESLFPEFSRGLAELGAQLIINVTNDSWYGTWQEPYQHLYMTLARAVEFRRPVIRTTNTGISTVALASGKILKRSPLHQEWFGQFRVPYRQNPQPTFYQRWFNLVPTLLWLTLLILLCIAWKDRIQSRKRAQ